MKSSSLLMIGCLLARYISCTIAKSDHKDALLLQAPHDLQHTTALWVQPQQKVTPIACISVLHVSEMKHAGESYHEHQPCRKALLAHLPPLHPHQLHWPAQHGCGETCLQLCCSTQASPCAFRLAGLHRNACWWSPIVLHVIRSQI